MYSVRKHFAKRARRIHFWVWIFGLPAVPHISVCMYACGVECLCARVAGWFCFYFNIFLLYFSAVAAKTTTALFFGWHHYGRCYIEGAHSLHTHTPRSSRTVHPVERKNTIAYTMFAVWKYCHYVNCCQTARTHNNNNKKKKNKHFNQIIYKSQTRILQSVQFSMFEPNETWAICEMILCVENLL